MSVTPRPGLCERIRAWAALAPDEELSELERKLLANHLARCGSCSGFAADVAAATAELRRAPALAPTRRVEVPSWRRRTAHARLRSVGAAAAVALMAVGVAARPPLPVDQSEPLQLPRMMNFSSDAEHEVELILRRTSGDLGLARLRPSRDGDTRHV